MREKSRYQMNVAVVMNSLRMRSGKESAEAEAARVYKKFSETRQEPVKMATALWGFFLKDGITPSQKQEFSAYLKPRVRNAVETLVEEDEPEKMKTHIVIDGNAFYEIDEECLRQKMEKEQQKAQKQQRQSQRKNSKSEDYQGNAKR